MEKSKNKEVQEPMEVEEIEENEGGLRIGDIYIPPPPPPACSFDSTGPRLIITHIENMNFKSYAGKQVLGPFHKNFTSIVGPNGSGKSNVIDSMLFVFGYRAQKIRSKKISVLIHNSDTYSNVESCSVNVHFQLIIDKDGDDYDIVPNSQFSISRTAFKDNSSWYAINDRRVQFKEVAKLLRSHGIDLDHNRFLILQGEVEQIAMMKAKSQGEHDTGMLEFLEDIIGCNRFKEPIEKLASLVEELNERRVEKLNRVKTVEKEKDDLEGVRNEAVEYLKLENNICLKKNILHQAYRHEAQIQLENGTAKKESITVGMKGVLEELGNLKSLKTAKQKEYEKMHEISEKWMKIVEENKEEYGELERQDVQCRENLKHSKAKAKKLVKILESEEQKLEDLKMHPEKLEKELNELGKKKVKLEAEKKTEEKKLTQVMACLKQETQELQEEKDKYEAELIELKKVVNETKSKMDIAQSELDLYLSNEKNEQMKLQDMIRNQEKASKALKEKESMIKEAHRRIPETESLLEESKKNLVEIVNEEASLSQEVKKKRLKVEEARSAMHASRSRGKVLEALMQQRELGALKGIFGRLGDLGAIDEEYDVAISTACGPLDNIVTDTMTTAQKSVEYLKRNHVGVATFIALDKMERWIPYTKQKISTPENVPRLFDLVKVKDERILPAFYFALRDTLVAKDLDQATRIGLQGRTRHRVVTLKGELIDLSGTMSGGGGRVSKGRMGRSVVGSDISTHEVERMLKQLDDMSRTSSDLKEKKTFLEDKIDAMQKELSALSYSLQKNDMEFQAVKEHEASLTTQIEDQKLKIKSSAPDKTKVFAMQKNVDKAKKGYSKADEIASAVESKVQKLHSQIMDITEGKVGAAQRSLDSLNNQIDGVSSSITKSTVAVKTAHRNIKKCEEKIISIQQETQENKMLIEKLIEEFKLLENKAQKVMEKLESADKEKDTCEEQKRTILNELNGVKEKENKLNSDHIEVKNELEKCAAAVKDYQSKIKHWNAQLAKLSLQDIEDKTAYSLPILSEEEIQKVDAKDVQYEIVILQEKLQNMKPNMAAIAEYRKKEAQYCQRALELDEITDQRDKQRRHHDELRKQRLNEFMAGFSIITAKLKEMYQMITLGGDAELELVDSLDPFSEGIVFSVRPPKKSWKNISNLSGGEKTLSSLALVFALHYYKPTPLYVMDEIDAALDFKNVSIVGNYIKERTKNAQFVIISLRNNMFELSDRLVGIYKTHNCTKSVTINPNKIANCDGER